jgi:hypothetical protein
MVERKVMVDGGDPQARAVKKGHGISCHVDFVGDSEGEKHVGLPEHIHHLKLLVVKIKEELALWSLAGAKAVGNVMSRE